MIPYLSLMDQTAGLREEILAGLGQVIDGQGFANGPAVAQFEREFATYLGCRDTIGVNSGTSALHLALLAAGVGPGHEVITTAFTFLARAGDHR